MTLQLISRSAQASAEFAVSRETASVLGGAMLGEYMTTVLPTWPVQRIFAPLFASTAAVIEETWLTDLPPVLGNSEGIRWSRSGNLLYGVLEIAEADFAQAKVPAVQAASAEAYRRIFRLIDAQNLPHLWRVWNYLAAINQEVDGLERYRQFNIGRQDAFLEFNRDATGNVPAACALGLLGGPLSIAFMASDRPIVPVENPRQISAYDYPAEYGPRRPTFSRAALAYLPRQEILFVSGTASIVGYQSVHPGDVVAQTRESLANVTAVLAEANQCCDSPPYTLAELSYRVYVRHADDFPAVELTLSALIGRQAEIVYVQADICRHDLLIEIEAFAAHRLDGD
ncbi:MAG: hypothetical protein CVU16_05560 [Betaproteobacteria bacterium HGW-Betaproteobacteria-10]|nr:MAG: hypothetical protein CVU16_05560 [Betaproteobacteria bacterium HGW-Betaproteobacteria-10]